MHSPPLFSISAITSEMIHGQPTDKTSILYAWNSYNEMSDEIVLNKKTRMHVYSIDLLPAMLRWTLKA